MIIMAHSSAKWRQIAACYKQRGRGWKSVPVLVPQVSRYADGSTVYVWE
jgi:hypothetical protein